MRNALVAICMLVVAIAAVALFVEREDVLPPNVVFTSGKESGLTFHVDGSVFELTVEAEAPSAGSTATLHQFGTTGETVRLDDTVATFRPFVLPPGYSEMGVEVQRRIGPLSLSRWYTLQTIAGGESALTLAAPDRVWSNRLPVEGRARPRDNLQILVNGAPTPVLRENWAGDIEESDSIWADQNGRYSGFVLLSEPGRYDVSVMSDKDSARTATQIVEFSAHLPPLLERKLSIFLGRNEIRYRLSARLQPGDPRIQAALEEDVSAKVYGKTVFGEVRFNNGYYADARWDRPFVRMKGNTAEVQQEIRGIPASAIQDGELEVSLPYAVHTLRDELEIQWNGLDVRGFAPGPTTVTEAKATWNGGSASVPPKVTVVVDSSKAVLRPWALGPRDVLPPILAGAYFDLLAIVPILWLLALLRRGVADRPASHRLVLQRDAVLLAGR